MSFDSQKDALSRKPVWLVKIHLDQCSNTFGIPPCTAAAVAPFCYYTYSTCKDRLNYHKADYVWKFISRDSQLWWLGPNPLPLLEKVGYIPIEIDAKYNLARRGEMILELSDDPPHYYANPSKIYGGLTISNLETAGSFWKNLLARNPNHYHRLAEVYLGFGGLEESEFRLFFRGLIEKIEYQEFGVVITVKDLLKNLDRLSHPKASDNCKLSHDYSGGSNLKVYQGDQLSDWGIIKCEGGKYVKFSGKTGPDGQGVWILQNAAFCFGGSGTVQAGKMVKQVLVYARDNSGIDEGFSADWILLDLICERARVSPAFLESVDSGATLSSDIDADDETIPVSGVGLFPDQGVIKIDDELIIYKGKNGNNLVISGTGSGDAAPLFYRHFRGAFRTTAGSHNSGAEIYLPRITYEAMNWLAGTRYRAEFEEPKKTQEILNQICEQALIQCWQNEASKIDSRAISPPQPGEAIKELNDQEHLLEQSVSVLDDRELQSSRVIVYYKPLEADPEAKPKSYQSALVEVEEDIENENWLGEEKPKIFFANWIYQSPEAAALASRYLLRYKQGARQLKLNLELKDLDLEVGKLFWVKTGKILNERGEKSRLLFQALKKQFRSAGRIEILAIETRLDLIYAYIGPKNPTLNETISSSATTVKLTLTGNTYQNDDFADSGQIRIEDEKISYASKSYNSQTGVLTLSGCARGILGTSPVGHNAGVDALILYNGASQLAKDKYAWSSDENNLLDADGNGEGDQEGYYIY